MQEDNFFFFKRKTAYEFLLSLVGSEMCIRARADIVFFPNFQHGVLLLLLLLLLLASVVD